MASIIKGPIGKSILCSLIISLVGFFGAFFFEAYPALNTKVVTLESQMQEIKEDIKEIKGMQKTTLTYILDFVEGAYNAKDR